MSTVLSRRDFLVATTAVGTAGALAASSVLAQGASQAPAAVPAGAAGAPVDQGPLAEVATGAAYKQPTGERELVIGSLDQLEREASEVIPAGAFAYIAAGADRQVTLRQNRRAFDRVRLLPQYLVGKEATDLGTELLGEKLSMPIITAPMGAHGLAHTSAELGSAKGTGDAGTLYTASTAANERIEDIAAATKGPKWFQLYLHDDRGLSRELLQRAKAAGYSAIVFTIDAFAPGASDEALRLGFSFPPSLPLVNSGTPFFKKSLSWADVDFIKETSDLPLIVKGVVSPRLARQAVERGAAGIQVSNHGGRGLDTVPAAIELLPAVVEAVQGRVPIIMDSGIRRGTDVFKALAMGANAVALGRPVLYGLALGGSPGVKSVFDRISEELSRAMMIAGASRISEIDSSFLYAATGELAPEPPAA